jgi:hypothetical protein
MPERHTAASEAEQDLVYELLRERLFELFGPGGSFRISLGRPAGDDSVFVSTIADTIAHDVARAFNPERTTAPRRLAAPETIAQHEQLWNQIAAELLIRRNGPDSIDVDVDRELASARDGGSLAARLSHRAA